MIAADSNTVKYWSTTDVEPTRRPSYFGAALSEAVGALNVENVDAKKFGGEVSFANLGMIGVCKASGSAHGTTRGRPEIARSASHTFNLLLSLKASWTAEHRGEFRMEPRDILIVDSEFPIRTDVRTDFLTLYVGVTDHWLRQWIPSPGVLAARRIPGDSNWGLALSSFLGELSPELAAAPPLPLSVIADQVGSLLALTASAMHSVAAPPETRGLRSLHPRIQDCVTERCTEPHLVAAHVADTLGISVRSMHRALASSDTTFGAMLINARTHTAIRMLSSPLFRRISTAEVGRRAGFLSASHFLRVIRKRTGMTPPQLRRNAAP